MRHAHRVHPEELMKPDLLSETLVIGVVLAVVAALLFVLLQALP
jgi:hypothetical protein